MSYYQGDYYQGDGPSLRKVGRWFRKSKVGRKIKRAASILAPIAVTAIPFAGAGTLVGRAAAASRTIKSAGRAVRAGGTPGLRSITQPNARATADDQVAALTGYDQQEAAERAYRAEAEGYVPVWERSAPRRSTRRRKRRTTTRRRSRRTTRSRRR